MNIMRKGWMMDIVGPIQKIKNYLNDLDYSLWSTRIMSEAIEFSEDADTVNAFLKANYENHYGK